MSECVIKCVYPYVSVSILGFHEMGFHKSSIIIVSKSNYIPQAFHQRMRINHLWWQAVWVNLFCKPTHEPVLLLAMHDARRTYTEDGSEWTGYNYADTYEIRKVLSKVLYSGSLLRNCSPSKLVCCTAQNLTRSPNIKIKKIVWSWEKPPHQCVQIISIIV